MDLSFVSVYKHAKKEPIDLLREPCLFSANHNGGFTSRLPCHIFLWRCVCRELMSGGGLSLLASVSSRKVCARNNKFSGPSDVFSDLWKILLAIGGEHFLFTMKVPSWRTLLFLLIVVINVSFCQSDATNSSSEWVVFSFNLKKLPVPNCVYTGQLFLSSF